MSKILYPRPSHPKAKAPKKNSVFDLPYHVYYEDPKEQIEGEWKHYGSELAVKLDAWYRCKFLGFHTEATLYDKDEFKDGAMGSRELT